MTKVVQKLKKSVRLINFMSKNFFLLTKNIFRTFCDGNDGVLMDCHAALKSGHFFCIKNADNLNPNFRSPILLFRSKNFIALLLRKMHSSTEGGLKFRKSLSLVTIFGPKKCQKNRPDWKKSLLLLLM